MIYLNLLNKIFGPKNPLTRKEIDRLKEGASSHSLEDRVNDEGFNQEAMEGWSTVSTDVDSSMHSMDKKMAAALEQSHTSKENKSIYIFLGIFSFTMLTLIFYTYQGNTLETLETDVLTSEKAEDAYNANIITDSEKRKEKQNSIAAVDNYTEIDTKQQITKEQLKSIEDDSQITLDIEGNERENEDVTNIETLSPKNLSEVPTNEAGQLSYKIVPEIYLSELKSVDYRGLRENEPIQLIQELPMGTPADQANTEDQEEQQTETITKDVDYMEYLEVSQRLFVKHNFKRALKRYLIILEQYQEDVNAHFYSGLCYHNLGQYEKAIEHFDKSYTISLGNFREEALWFKAKALIQQDKKSAVKMLLESIKKEGGFYSEEAAELLRSLK
jgi:tetratricopeptide (TPR) repeat protein